jgi:hypothetical protein
MQVRRDGGPWEDVAVQHEGDVYYEAIYQTWDARTLDFRRRHD